jgi:aquaporin Z
MISVAVVTALLEHPASPLQQAISEPLLRRFIIGVAMGLTAIFITYSPWGKQSGAGCFRIQNTVNNTCTLKVFHMGW